MMELMLMPLKRYADFQGRSRRTEYWMFFLFNILVGIILGLVDFLIGLTNFGVGDVATLALLIPNIAVAVRRLHDTDRSGWWYGAFLLFLIVFVAWMVGSAISLGASAMNPFDNLQGGMLAVVGIGGLGMFIYSIMLLVFFCLEGTRGPNRFGPDPKGDGAALGDVFS